MLKHIYKEENIMGLWDSLNRVAERAAYEMEKSMINLKAVMRAHRI